MQTEITAADRRIIDNLPNFALSHASSFLTPSERGLFALSLTPNFDGSRGGDRGREQLTPASRAVVDPPSQWAVLDLSRLVSDAPTYERMMKMQSDDVVRDILLCVDARETVRRLTLPKPFNYGNLTGRYLSALSGSTVLEQVRMTSCSSLSPAVYLPFLRTIVRAEGNSLKHVDFPAEEWEQNYDDEFGFFDFEPQETPAVSEFKREFKSARGGLKCDLCDGECFTGWEGQDDTIHRRGLWSIQGNQLASCVDCLLQVCESCSKVTMQKCGNCMTISCTGCRSLTRCAVCRGCDKCTSPPITCIGRGCNESVCRACIIFCKGCYTQGCPLCTRCRCEY